MAVIRQMTGADRDPRRRGPTLGHVPAACQRAWAAARVTALARGNPLGHSEFRVTAGCARGRQQSYAVPDGFSFVDRSPHPERMSMDTIGYSPLIPAVVQNPYPYYAALREQAPVYQVPMLGYYAISRYEDVFSVLKNPALFGAGWEGFIDMVSGAAGPYREQMRRYMDVSIVNTNPPAHTRLRGLVSRAFTSARIAALEPRIRELARTLIADALARPEVDLMADVAIPLPTMVLAEMLGMEPELRSDFQRWSETLMMVGPWVLGGRDPGPIVATLQEFEDCMTALLHQRRREPREDLLSVIANTDVSGDGLTDDEIARFIRFLVVAGTESTTSLIGNVIRALLEHPDHLARIRQDRSLLPGAIEESLRFDSIAHVLLRKTTQEVTIAGTTIPAGAGLFVLLASANRDPRMFADPDRFDITRDNRNTVPFGYGIHYCSGAPLARLEAGVAITELLSATRDISFAPGQAGRFEWGESIFVRGLKSLRLCMEPARPAS
jgi:cytochrome P450